MPAIQKEAMLAAVHKLHTLMASKKQADKEKHTYATGKQSDYPHEAEKEIESLTGKPVQGVSLKTLLANKHKAGANLNVPGGGGGSGGGEERGGGGGGEDDITDLSLRQAIRRAKLKLLEVDGHRPANSRGHGY